MPNRIIKDSIRTSKSVNQLTDFQFRLWVYLITYVDDYGRGSADPEILKGFVFPRRKGVTESNIEKELANLASSGLITLYNVGGESYFCFPNWGEHQRIQTKKSKYPAPEKAGENFIPQKSTVDHGGSPPESNPIQSNPNTESESEYNLSACGECDRFERFWSAYPKKQGKEDARKRFKKINPSEALLQRMLFAIEEQKKSDQWKAERGRFIPNPSTWLNRGQWEDETLTEIPVTQDVGSPIGRSFDTDDLFQAALKRSSGDWLKN